ncbi:MAG: hypothetical protein IJ689_01850 [Alphaproteobacteria bacterium]|nr:hypothetical protein [Alphaproteobacteria bacterium]
MKNYILMLGIAAVSIGSYCAYAGNSATMTVTATITHDVSLSVTQDLDLGTITINPAYTKNDTDWGYSESGVIMYSEEQATVSASNATVGTFTANIPNPSACNGLAASCGGLQVKGDQNNNLFALFGGSDDTNGCNFNIGYSGSGNNFVVYPWDCWIEDVSKVTTGTHTRALTISYTAG